VVMRMGSATHRRVPFTVSAVSVPWKLSDDP
jgi:hypothetical protein